MTNEQDQVNENIEQEEIQETSADNVEVVEEKETEANPLAEELEALNKRYMLLLADFDNYKRRTQTEKAKIYETGNMELVKELLPVLDSFDMAFANLPENIEEPLASFLTGMEGVRKQLMDALEKEGLAEVAAMGEIYDPVCHEAIMMVDDASVPDQTIIDVLRTGYRFKDQVIRPTVCRVAKN